MSSQNFYRGRFAPSPTGELHFGSLIAALGSWLDARAAGGEWLLRIEDVDTPRNVPGAATAILRMLEALGLDWDGEVIYQSGRVEAYAAAIEFLARRGDVFACTCSRREVATHAMRRAKDGAWVYPGTCRGRLAVGDRGGDRGLAWRLKVPDAEIAFDDRLQGRISENLATEVGDFVLARADGQYAYQLAVVVDDGWQGISDVVRGADLLDSTPRQIYLQRRLGLPQPRYLHLPLVTNAAGEKLSKQTRAPPLRASAAARHLFDALVFLGLEPGPVLRGAAPRELLTWAVGAWDPWRLPRRDVEASPAQGVRP